jgi:hypothetical protein
MGLLTSFFRKSDFQSAAAEIPADAEGQYQLGFKYASGRGVQKDFVVAYKWLTIAIAHGHEHATELRNLISERMQPDQIAEAERLATAHVPLREPAY